MSNSYRPVGSLQAENLDPDATIDHGVEARGPPAGSQTTNRAILRP